MKAGDTIDQEPQTRYSTMTAYLPMLAFEIGTKMEMEKIFFLSVFILRYIHHRRNRLLKFRTGT